MQPGTILHLTANGLPLEYFAYMPTSGQKDDRVLLSIHGISRNAEEHVRGFLSLAEHYGSVILAPLFKETDFKRYQRLGRSSSEGRADLAFDRMLQDAAEQLDIKPTPLHIFGFSGGGQFTHRYAMFYPKRVARMVLAAPGWYTFPDPNRYYPFGLRSSREWPSLQFSPETFLKVPTMVLVGEDDDIRDEDLNTMRRIDAVQGFNRMERGRRWVRAMRSLGNAFNIDGNFNFEVVPGAGHAYQSYLAHPQFADKIFRFLFGQ